MKKLIVACSIVAFGAGFAGFAHAFDIGGVDIHAFVSQGFVQTTKENNFPVSNSGQGSFNFNEFGINFGKQLTPDLRVGMQLFAQDRGSYGKDEVTIDWAYGDYRYADWLGFRAGKIKNPMGLYNETRDNDSLRTAILLPQGIYTDSQRETAIALSGAGIYGTVPLGQYGSLAYQLQAGVLPIKSDGGTAQTVASLVPGGSTPTDASSKTTVVQQLEWRTPLDGLRLSATGLQSRMNVKTTTAAVDYSIDLKNYQRYVYSAEYTWNDLVVAGEYMREDFDADTTGTTLVDLPTGLPAPYDILPAGSVMTSSQENKRDSWYAGATYRFNEMFEAGAYYNEFYGNRDQRNSNYQKDTALALRIDPLKNIVLKIEGHIIDGTSLLIDGTGAKKDWYLFATKATFSF